MLWWLKACLWRIKLPEIATMDEKSLYAHILNLSVPLQVKSLSLDENVSSVTVTIGIAENTQLTRPTCGKFCPFHDHRHRKWRHLDTCSLPPAWSSPASSGYSAWQ